eukprot:m.299333 g.299333  ORF g.299333 m.299333 type:complete len:371 (-) comp15869_c1_seq2:2318-3430(-)
MTLATQLLPLAVLAAFVVSFAPSCQATAPSVTHSWIFNKTTDIPYCHMSMLAQLPNGTMFAAFQASSISEGCNDQAIHFTRSDDFGKSWAKPTIAMGDKLAVWGPVLHYDVDTEILWLFHTASTPFNNRPDPNCAPFGRSYPGGEVRYSLSYDLGRTWSTPVVMLTFQDRGQIGKMTANTLVVEDSGRWLLPYWSEQHSDLDIGPECSGVLLSDDKGGSWAPFGCIGNNDTWLIENTLAQLPSGNITQLFRTRAGYIYQSWSMDNGTTWSTATKTSLLNPDSKVCLATDKATTTTILAYNPSKDNRYPLILATTTNGVAWNTLVTLDSDPSSDYSYPTPIVGQNKDGQSVIYTSYSTSNGIKLSTVNGWN